MGCPWWLSISIELVLIKTRCLFSCSSNVVSVCHNLWSRRWYFRRTRRGHIRSPSTRLDQKAWIINTVCIIREEILWVLSGRRSDCVVPRFLCYTFPDRDRAQSSCSRARIGFAVNTTRYPSMSHRSCCEKAFLVHWEGCCVFLCFDCLIAVSLWNVIAIVYMRAGKIETQDYKKVVIEWRLHFLQDMKYLG